MSEPRPRRAARLEPRADDGVVCTRSECLPGKATDMSYPPGRRNAPLGTRGAQAAPRMRRRAFFFRNPSVSADAAILGRAGRRSASFGRAFSSDHTTPSVAATRSEMMSAFHPSETLGKSVVWTGDWRAERLWHSCGHGRSRELFSASSNGWLAGSPRSRRSESPLTVECRLVRGAASVGPRADERTGGQMNGSSCGYRSNR